jgi:hypothetical protein
MEQTKQSTAPVSTIRVYRQSGSYPGEYIRCTLILLASDEAGARRYGWSGGTVPGLDGDWPNMIPGEFDYAHQALEAATSAGWMIHLR